RLLEIVAKVAGGRLLADHRLAPARPGLVLDRDGEVVDVDVAVRAVLSAQPAADAPVLDEDLERVPATDRPDGTPDHAQRIAARAAGRRDQVLVEPKPVADEPGDAVVRVGARTHAQIAARAPIEVEEQEVLRLHEALSEEVADRHRRHPLVTLLVLADP